MTDCTVTGIPVFAYGFALSVYRAVHVSVLSLIKRQSVNVLACVYSLIQGSFLSLVNHSHSILDPKIWLLGHKFLHSGSTDTAIQMRMKFLEKIKILWVHLPRKGWLLQLVSVTALVLYITALRFEGTGAVSLCLANNHVFMLLHAPLQRTAPSVPSRLAGCCWP